jgi:hypothetical protein
VVVAVSIDIRNTGDPAAYAELTAMIEHILIDKGRRLAGFDLGSQANDLWEQIHGRTPLNVPTLDHPHFHRSAIVRLVISHEAQYLFAQRFLATHLCFYLGLAQPAKLVDFDCTVREYSLDSELSSHRFHD